MTHTINPSRARLGGLLRFGGATHLITSVGAPVRFDDRGWPVEIAVETEPCSPQPTLCTFTNADGLPCLNEAETGGRCDCHPI